MAEDNVHIIGLKPFEIRFHTRDEFIHGGVLGLIAVIADPADFGRDNKFIPPALHGLAEKLLAMTISIDVGSVKKIDAHVQRFINGGESFLVFGGSPLGATDGPEP